MLTREFIPQVERPIADPARPSRGMERIGRFGTAGIDEGLMGIVLLAGSANVIMQLARPEVGYGVAESRVISGRTDVHPIKRARTTFTYLAVAGRGDDAQKAAYRRAVNRAHAQVHSTETSPITYNAFDRDLQLWVAACLYKGSVDIYRMFIGELDGADAERHYREGITLGTTLQVRPEMWPADRAAFDEYWEQSLEKLHIDDTVREYLMPVAALRPGWKPLPGPLGRRADDAGKFITAGFLPQRFRDEMGFAWEGAKQRRFDALIAALRTGNSLLPPMIRRFPFNVLLWDLDRRIKAGTPLV